MSCWPGWARRRRPPGRRRGRWPPGSTTGAATSWRPIGLGRQVGGDLEAALDAYEQSLALADHLDLFACWAAARAALVQVALGRCDDAAPLVDKTLALGPALGQHEARWAAAELAVARGDDSARRVVDVALDTAERVGLEPTTRGIKVGLAAGGHGLDLNLEPG